MVAPDLPSEEALLADLRATFPGLPARPVREFGVRIFHHGVWTGDSCAVMPDGLPVFDQHGCEDGYDGGIHEAFTAWLELRGWYIENYDGATFLIIPIALAVCT